MKKLLYAIAIIVTASFASCTKENVAPTHKATALADKNNLGQYDDQGNPINPPVLSDKNNLGQYDDQGGN